MGEGIENSALNVVRDPDQDMFSACYEFFSILS